MSDDRVAAVDALVASGRASRTAVIVEAIDRLVADGLVARGADAGDRRNSRITLSDAGRELFERVVPAHLDNERRLMAALGEREQELLAGLLRKMLVEFEGSVPPPAVGPLRSFGRRSNLRTLQ